MDSADIARAYYIVNIQNVIDLTWHGYCTNTLHLSCIQFPLFRLINDAKANARINNIKTRG